MIFFACGYVPVLPVLWSGMPSSLDERSILGICDLVLADVELRSIAYSGVCGFSTPLP